MNIGYDGSRINVSQRTGTENYSYQILKHLLQIDQQNNYMVYSRSKLSDQSLEAGNVTNKVINMRRLWTQAGLAYEVIRHKPDVLFIPAHTLPVFRPLNLKTVVTIHDLGAEYLPQYHQFPAKLYLNRSTEYAAKYATHLIAVSEYTKKDLISKMGVDSDRISVVYEGVDQTELLPKSDQDIQAIKLKYNIHQDYILFVGTIQPRKNLVNLIEAYAKLLPQNVQLVIAGGKGWMSDDIYAAPARLKIEDKVTFLGYIDEEDKAALYSGASATALISHFEGFGLPIVESMACGTPVIASDASSLPEVVGEAGILVPPNDVDAISSGLNEILTNHKLRQSLIESGFDQASKFNWSDAASQTLRVIERVAG